MLNGAPASCDDSSAKNTFRGLKRDRASSEYLGFQVSILRSQRNDSKNPWLAGFDPPQKPAPVAFVGR